MADDRRVGAGRPRGPQLDLVEGVLPQPDDGALDDGRLRAHAHDEDDANRCDTKDEGRNEPEDQFEHPSELLPVANGDQVVLQLHRKPERDDTTTP